jgi:hypothetical protein
MHDSRRRSPRLARPTGLEPATVGLEGRCSIRLSYGRISGWIVAKKPTHRVIALNHPPATASQGGRGRGIRTPDTLLPKQVRYQAALYPAAPDLSELNGAERGRDTTNAAPLRQSGQALRARSATIELNTSSLGSAPKTKGAEAPFARSSKLARPERFELPTTKFVAWYSIQLSYGRVEPHILSAGCAYCPAALRGARLFG